MINRNLLSPTSAALVVTVAGAATILGAWGFELIGGLAPCPLCLEQRIPYYAGLPVSALALATAWRGLQGATAMLLGVVALLMLWGSGLGAYHAGIEWAWWTGPETCAGGGGFPTEAGALIESLQSEPMPRCTEAAWRFLGISLAGYNALISLGLAAIAAAGAVVALRRPD